MEEIKRGTVRELPKIKEQTNVLSSEVFRLLFGDFNPKEVKKTGEMIFEIKGPEGLKVYKVKMKGNEPGAKYEVTLIQADKE